MAPVLQVKHTLKVDQTAYVDKTIERVELEDMLADRVTPLPILSSTDDLIVAMGGDNVFKYEKLIE